MLLNNKKLGEEDNTRAGDVGVPKISKSELLGFPTDGLTLMSWRDVIEDDLCRLLMTFTVLLTFYSFALFAASAFTVILCRFARGGIHLRASNSCCLNGGSSDDKDRDTAFERDFQLPLVRSDRPRGNGGRGSTWPQFSRLVTW